MKLKTFHHKLGEEYNLDEEINSWLSTYETSIKVITIKQSVSSSLIFISIFYIGEAFPEEVTDESNKPCSDDVKEASNILTRSLTNDIINENSHFNNW